MPLEMRDQLAMQLHQVSLGHRSQDQLSRHLRQADNYRFPGP